jgi:hypothetical protein
MGKSGMVQFRAMWLAFVKTVMNITDSKKIRGIFTSTGKLLASEDGAFCMEFVSSLVRSVKSANVKFITTKLCFISFSYNSNVSAGTKLY